MSISTDNLIHKEEISQVLSCMVKRFNPDEFQSEDVEQGGVRFLDNHLPGIKEGTYTLGISQDTSPTGNETYSLPDHKFHINGPRFHISPDDILSVFPPAGSQGDHAHVLPHIAFKRISLPWEVDGKFPLDKSALSNDDPWLALLVFSDTEIPEVQTKTLHEIGIPDDNYHDGDEQVNVIEVDSTTLQTLFPKKTELAFLAHVRQKTVETPDELNGNEPMITGEKAYVVANRLPQNDTTSVVHLVSLVDYPSAGKGTFISLYQWQFSCVKRPDFKKLLQQVDARAFRLYDENQGIDNKYFLGGYVPLPHFMRKGLQTLSWYRSPLVPDPRFPGGLNSDFGHSSDDYLQLTNENNMLHVSYATAWQLGRMLTLQNKDVALAIQRLKRQVAQAVKSIQDDKAAYLAFLQTKTLTENQQKIKECVIALKAQADAAQDDGDGSGTTFSCPTECDDLEFDLIVARWLVQLITLKAVPFNYLVPHESMLPPNSMRFFVLDENWLIALIEGALSIGGHERMDLEQLGATQGKVFSGFLLRSEVVGDYPDMHIAGYDYVKDDDLKEDGKQPIIKTQLSSEVLLCMFPFQIQSIDLFLKKEALHMGFAVGDDLEKSCRDKDGDVYTREVKEVEEALLLPLTTDVNGVTTNSENAQIIVGKNGVLNINTLIATFNSELDKQTNAEAITLPHHFALQMMEGVPKVRFDVG